MEAALTAFIVLVLAAAAVGLKDYWRNLAQNTAADLIGAGVVVYAIVPVARRLRKPAPAAEDIDQPATAPTVEPNTIADSGGAKNLTAAGRQEPRPWPHRVGHVPPRVKSHQPRAQADRLRQLAAGNGTSVLDQAILIGMGGVGKTQIAADHARSAWDAGELDVLVWITANSRGGLVGGLAQAGVELCRADPGDAEQAAAAFLAWLAPAPGSASSPTEDACRWMVVLDDVADPDDLRGLWPPASPHGRTLVTTRRRETALEGADRSPIDVSPFDHTEALAYLTDALAAHQRVEPADQLADLASDLGHLPLALAQAAAYVVDAQVSCAEYRALLADRTTRLRDAAPDRLPDEQPLTVAATWSLSVDHADTLRPRGMARPMLQIASFLDGNGIPGAVLTSGPVRTYLGLRIAGPATSRSHEPSPAPVSVQDAHKALTALHRLSLVSYSPNTPHATVLVHVLVQRTTRDSLEPDQITPAAHAAAEALTAVWPDQEPEPDLPQALRANTASLIRHSESALLDPDIHPVLIRVGTSLSESGNAVAAIRHFTRLLRHASGHLGDENPSVLAVRRHLATQHGQHGDVEKAISDMQCLLTDDLRILGPDDRETLAARHDLIWWQWSAGDRDGAERDLTVLLADRDRVLGPDDPDTLETRHNLYSAWADAGRNAEAIDAYTQLLADLTRIQGPDHASTISVRHQIAGLRERINGDIEGSIRDMTKVVQARIHRQGPTHPDTMAARQFLARMYGEAGDAKAAVEALEALYEERVRVQGADHPDTLTTRRILAHWTAESASPADALTMLVDLLELHLRVLGPNHPSTLDTRFEIYILRGKTGHVAEACEALAQLVVDRCRIQGANHYDTQRTQQALDAMRAQEG